MKVTPIGNKNILVTGTNFPLMCLISFKGREVWNGLKRFGGSKLEWEARIVSSQLNNSSSKSKGLYIYNEKKQSHINQQCTQSNTSRTQSNFNRNSIKYKSNSIESMESNQTQSR